MSADTDYGERIRRRLQANPTVQSILHDMERARAERDRDNPHSPYFDARRHPGGDGEMSTEFDLRVISLGAGRQSTAMYLLAATGELEPLPDVAIFADTGAEPQYVYDHLDELERRFGHLIPVRRAKRPGKNLREIVQLAAKGDSGIGDGRFATVPFWVQGQDGKEAPGRRQCTREYKIDVIQHEVRSMLGLKPRQRAAGRFQVEEWVGISVDEAHRAKPARYSWVTTRWPLLYDVPMRSSDCVAYVRDVLGYEPAKSSCTFCPYRTDWLSLREREPEAFEDACRVDEAIRANGGMRGMQYVHRSLRPLREVVAELEEDPQIDLFGNECGVCGT